MPCPDGLAVNPKTGTIFMSVPNFSRRPNDTGKKVKPAVIAKVSADGKAEVVVKLEEIENIKVSTGQIGPMGLAFGPDGHLYICDNQYFFDTNRKSRILRILMDGDTPTGKIEIAVDGTKLSNALLWHNDNLYLSDTFFDIEGEYGSGGVWRFPKEEILTAGQGENPPIKVNAIAKAGDDPHLIALHTIKKIPGGGNGGPDGLTVDSNGVFYYGFFGTGEMHRLVFDAEGKPKSELIHPAGEYFHCCDGIFYDKGTNKVYITDSAANAIHAFTAPAVTEKPVFETIWENGNTNGADGSLDQPCEVLVIGKKMIAVNFDWPFPELLNTASEDPSTLSVIEL
jgi:DNA-binding beta-propeller fold protein YncE